MIDSKKQNILYALIILLVVVVFYIVSPSSNQSPQGIFLPNGAKNYSITDPNSIQIYQDMPRRAIVLGTIRTTKHFDSISQASDISNQNANIELARQLASKVGANGLVVTMIGRTYEAGPLDGFVLFAKAIRSY